MKKILSIALVAAMLLSLVVVATAVPAAAVDGNWDSMGTAAQATDDFTGIPNSRPGYEYTEEGLHMVPAEWKEQAPFGTLQTKEKVNLKDGVYMLVRVDDFTYAGDKWFNINIWDSKNIAPGSNDFGAGVQTLIRPGNAGANGEPGTITAVPWYAGTFNQASGANNMAEDAVKADEEGRPLMALTVTWDEAAKTYAADINGAAAPENIIAFMNEKWGGDDSSAYIGFTLQNNQKNGTVEATILKFGTTAEDATVPSGDDSKEPEEFNHVPADIADASIIPEGQPAVLMNGSVTSSHLMTSPISATGSNLAINDDLSVHVTATRDSADAGYWAVNYDTSFSIEDFPVCVTLTRNFCTCGEECYALETCDVYLCTGDTIQPEPACHITQLDMSYDPIVVGDDTYLMFYIDMSGDYAPFDATGRINGTRFDFKGIDINTPGANEFDVCWTAFFRNAEEAEAYVNEYLGLDDIPVETDPVETDPVETDPAETDPAETDPVETDPVETDPADQPDDPAESESESEVAEEAAGCASTVGFTAIAVIALAGASGFVAFKKRK